MKYVAAHTVLLSAMVVILVCAWSPTAIASRDEPPPQQTRSEGSTPSDSPHGARAEGHETEEHGFKLRDPIISENPMPITLLRLDYAALLHAGHAHHEDQTRHGVRLSGEYAPCRLFSAKLKIPYTVVDPEHGDTESNLGNVLLTLKVASWEFSDHGVLLGGGLETQFPTGDHDKGIGDDRIWTFTPFLDAGYANDGFQVVGVAKLDVMANLPDHPEEKSKFAFDLAAQYRAIPAFEFLLEVNGETVLGGEDKGKTIVNISPGAKLYTSERFWLGLSVGFPVTHDRHFDPRLILSALLEF